MNIKEYLDILKDLWTPTNASKIRMAINNALEMMGNNLKENIDRQDNVENQFQDVLDETTGKDVINGPEIIAARDGEANLKARLDKEHQEVAAQLAQTATESQLGRVKVDGRSIISDSEGVINTKNNMRPVSTPERFQWKTHPLVGKIFTDGLGNYTIKDFDLGLFKPVGKVYYVDRINGNDTNSGVSITEPLASLDVALAKEDVKVIKLAEGIYERTAQPRVVKKSVAIEAIEGHKVFLSNSQGPSFAQYENNVYVAAGTTGGNTFLNPSMVDDEGDWVEYKKVATINEVESTKGSFAFVNGNTYIQTHGGEIPAARGNYVRMARYDNLSVNGAVTFWMKDITLIGGDRVFTPINESSGEMRIFAENCEFKQIGNSSPEQNDIVWAKGVDLCVFKNCVASGGSKDGFNYVRHIAEKPSYAIEINCVGKNNGTEGEDQHQGSTIHRDCKIIRIGGLYYGNYGANVGDTHEGAQSWNLGLIAHTPKAADPSRRVNFHDIGVDDFILEGSLAYNPNGGRNVSNNVYGSNNSFYD